VATRGSALRAPLRAGIGEQPVAVQEAATVHREPAMPLD